MIIMDLAAQEMCDIAFKPSHPIDRKGKTLIRCFCTPTKSMAKHRIRCLPTRDEQRSHFAQCNICIAERLGCSPDQTESGRTKKCLIREEAKRLSFCAVWWARRESFRFSISRENRASHIVLLRRLWTHSLRSAGALCHYDVNTLLVKDSPLPQRSMWLVTCRSGLHWHVFLDGSQ
jgi:hypothetical protein